MQIDRFEYMGDIYKADTPITIDYKYIDFLNVFCYESFEFGVVAMAAKEENLIFEVISDFCCAWKVFVLEKDENLDEEALSCKRALLARFKKVENEQQKHTA